MLMGTDEAGSVDSTPALSWLHIGALHVTKEGEPNLRDLRGIVAQANGALAGALDFAVLPGDNADEGTADQFQLVRQAIDDLRLPVHILPGDHDFKMGSLTEFHGVLKAERLPKSLVVRDVRCVFLDVVSAGGGGPDFRIGEMQFDWLARELAAAGRAEQRSVVFMHTYPAYLRDRAADVQDLFARHRVACVDMGHTHYNELANDGRTIYAATRSTGQIEEGPVGFSLAALDSGVVCWRFKPLAKPWPFVLITSPADRRLVTDPTSARQVCRGECAVRALAWSDNAVTDCACRIDGDGWQPMSSIGGAAWQATCDTPDFDFALEVRAIDAAGRSDAESIAVASRAYVAPRRHADGSDRDAIGVWPEIGLLGTQLGPNRNGRQW